MQKHQLHAYAWEPLYHLLFPSFEVSQASYIQEEITPLIFNIYWKELPLSDYKSREFCDNLLSSNDFLFLRVKFMCILDFQPFILLCRSKPKTVSPFMRFLSELLDKRNIVHVYMVMLFPVLVLHKRECRTFTMEFSVEFR